MKYSKLFGRTRHTPPCDADSVNAKLLTQAGFIEKLAAGIYNFLPLGHRVLTKVCNIIREEMNAVEGQEILMPALHPVDIWETTGRRKGMDEILYKTRASGDKEFVFGPSHEEVVTPLASKYIQSYKDLPLYVYQIQTKFRDEPRAKSGLLRGREFGMKDLYSFHTDEADLDRYYEIMKGAYLNVFNRCGLTAYVIEASGGAFSDKFSHEFSVETPAGEDVIIICKKCGIAQNIEVAKDHKDGLIYGKTLEDLKKGIPCPKCKGPLEEIKAVEAGNIFKLGTKFSEAFGLNFANNEGKLNHVVMGCYGIGTTRLVGTIVEAKHDEKGMIWPKSVAPYLVNLVSLGNDEDVLKEAENLYETLLKEGIEVLFDDRDAGAGVKLKDSDLIGIPLRIVISKRTLESKGVEWKERTNAESEIVATLSLVKKIKEFQK
ncbi:MAG: aminoacyl--tRNA ligase-related protein [Candidatus Peregrinibacteria bacterium]|nr:aminoacyl--tRNA ligase-related protein [Candidatus Peregrinibacteria bacterium]